MIFQPRCCVVYRPASWPEVPRRRARFCVEVRSESDYRAYAENAMVMKRADYFSVGTLVVWDVDLLSPDVIKSYDADNSDNARIFRRGDIAGAEPAVPGWRMPVDELFS